jgi:hypothetical protein
MNFAEKLEARTLMNELLEDGETFDPATARRLIELVPVRTEFNRAAHKGNKTFAYTPEMGNVGYEDPRGRHENPQYPERINGYGLHHEPGLMVITDEVGMTGSPFGKLCSIDYDPGTGEPFGMRAMKMHEEKFLFGLVTLHVPRMMAWKTPRPPSP